MIAKLHDRQGRLVAELPCVPDGTRELLVSAAVLKLSTDAPGVESGALGHLFGVRMRVRENAIDLFDPSPFEPA